MFTHATVADMLGYTTVDDGRSDPMKPVREQVMDAYFQRLEAELKAAAEAGCDLAVSDFAPDPETMTLAAKFIRVAPGAAELPPGRAWTIYHASRTDLAA